MSSEAQTTQTSRWLTRIDVVGMTMSGMCAIHCALTPVLAVVLPLLGAHETEETFRLVLALLGVVAVATGILLHRSVRAIPWLGGALGLFVTMAFADFSLPAEIALSIAASAAMITAHRLNSLACKAKCEASHCGTDGADCEG